MPQAPRRIKPKEETLVFVSAGEASGDARAAQLVEEALKLNPKLKFFGLGGPLLKAAGAEILVDMTQIAHLGLSDVLRNYFKYRKIFYNMLKEVVRRRPACALLVDYPGFNLRFAKRIHSTTPVLYYVSPQVWAWGKRRVKTIERIVKKMLLLFEFEKAVYQDTKLETEVVGHPLLEEVKPSSSSRDLREEWGIASDKQVIALLPGSREKEIKRILPIMLDAAARMRAEEKELEFLLSAAPNLPEELFRSILHKMPVPVKLIRGRSYDVIEACDTALVTSGTATLETALLEKPFFILYKASRLTALLARRLIQIPYLGIVNVIAGKMIVPEFLQEEAHPETIAHEALFLLREPDARQKMVQDLKEVNKKLGKPGASLRAAKALIRFLSESSKQ
jgi:lipid-A-disaccharide synthase